MPMYFSIKSTGIKPARKLFSAINILSGAKRVPMWGWEFSAALKMESNDSGKFYVPVFSSPTLLAAEEIEAMAGIRAQLANITLRADEGQEAPASGGVAPAEEDDKF
jgi:hypothetical protein